jgi:crotonobetainyl-CoA:carnitine CoA-transferase CaiB-like acyl-CoA transferase
MPPRELRTRLNTRQEGGGYGRYVTFQLAEVAIHLAAHQWYDFHEFGCHLKNVG